MKWHPPLVFPRHRPSFRCHNCKQNVPLHRKTGLPQKKYETVIPREYPYESAYSYGSPGFVCRGCFRKSRKCSVSYCRGRDFDLPFPDGFHCGECYGMSTSGICSCYHCRGFNEDGTRNQLGPKPNWDGGACERHGCNNRCIKGQKTCSKHTDS